MSEELIKRLQSHLRQLAPHVKERDTGQLLADCLSALTAQQPTEPVAWMYHDGESPDKPPSQFVGSTLLSFERMPNYRNERPLYTATQSGVMEVNTDTVSVPDYKELYLDLIMQVGKKWPDESRHDTAKRYIANAETCGDDRAAQEVKK